MIVIVSAGNYSKVCQIQISMLNLNAVCSVNHLTCFYDLTRLIERIPVAIICLSYAGRSQSYPRNGHAEPTTNF